MVLSSRTMDEENSLQMNEIEQHHVGPDQCYPSNSYITCQSDQAVKLRADDEEIASNPPVSVVTIFRKVAENNPDTVALVDISRGLLDVYTYKQYYKSVTHLAKAFIKLGLESSHGVGIIGFNSPQWFITYFGTIFAGGITVAIYPSILENTILYIAESTKCNIVVVEDDKLLEKFLKIADDLPHLKAIIQYKGQPKDGLKKVFSWTEIMEMNVADCEQEFKRRIRNMAPNKCCSVMATSGTTGKPKLAMRSHDNIIYHTNVLFNYVNEGQVSVPDTILSMPLAGLMLDMFWPLINNGGTIYFASPCAIKEALIDILRNVRPTVFFGVPRVWEMFMEVLTGSWKQTQNKSLDQPEQDISYLRDRVDIRNKLGLDRCRLTFVGSTPCRKEVFDFFSSCGITLLEMYGLSESSGPHTSNTLMNFKKYTVGKTTPGFWSKFRQHDNGTKELLMNGRHIFMGYLNDLEKTQEIFDQEFWLRTGDIVSHDEEGFITITARIKELIISSDGENIAPFPIENRVLKELPCLSHCIVIGEQKPFLTALLTLKSEVDPSDGRPKDELEGLALEWCQGLGSNATKVSEILTSQDPLIMNAIQKGIDKANQEVLSKTQCIQKWMILPRDFSMIDGELGPTMKMKRDVIYKIYQKEIQSLY